MGLLLLHAPAPSNRTILLHCSTRHCDSIEDQCNIQRCIVDWQGRCQESMRGGLGGTFLGGRAQFSSAVAAVRCPPPLARFWPLPARSAAALPWIWRAWPVLAMGGSAVSGMKPLPPFCCHLPGGSFLTGASLFTGTKSSAGLDAPGLSSFLQAPRELERPRLAYDMQDTTGASQCQKCWYCGLSPMLSKADTVACVLYQLTHTVSWAGITTSRLWSTQRPETTRGKWEFKEG